MKMKLYITLTIMVFFFISCNPKQKQAESMAQENKGTIQASTDISSQVLDVSDTVQVNTYLTSNYFVSDVYNSQTGNGLSFKKSGKLEYFINDVKIRDGKWEIDKQWIPDPAMTQRKNTQLPIFIDDSYPNNGVGVEEIILRNDGSLKIHWRQNGVMRTYRPHTHIAKTSDESKKEALSAQNKAEVICGCIDKTPVTQGNSFSYAPVVDCFGDNLPIGFLKKTAEDKMDYRALKKILFTGCLKGKDEFMKEVYQYWISSLGHADNNETKVKDFILPSDYSPIIE